MRRSLLLLLVVLVSTGFGPGDLEKGNRLFRAGKYEEAVAAYMEALEDGEDSPVLRYNLGTALLQLGRYDEAEEQLGAALNAVDPDTRQRVFYNLGQRYLEEARANQDPRAGRQLYDAAVEAYQQALRLAPGDGNAKWNYELALQEREQQPQFGGGGQGDPQEDDDPQQGGGGGGQAPGTTSRSPTGSTSPSGEQAPLTQEQAERILAAVEQDERELFSDRLRGRQPARRPARDW